MKKRFKRVGAAFLSLAMILGIMPGVTKPIEVLAANSEPTTAYWTEGSSLKTGYNLNGGTIANIRFGESDRKWAICGADGNDLALISTSQFTTAAYDSTSPYASKYSTSDFVTGIDTYLSTTYFSETELTKMQDVAVRTLEYDQSGTREANGSTVTLKLYLPDATSRTSYGSSSIYVGADNNIEIALANLSVTTTNGYFWLRSPSTTDNGTALVASPGGNVRSYIVDFDFVSVVPAFNLNLSSVIFASAASAASSSYNGDKANSTMTANTYTLRYAPTSDSWNNIGAEISADKKKIQVSNATSGMYLVVQNSEGVYIEDASTNPLVNASSIIINGTALTDFDNCEMWLESTTDRITTAKIIKTNHVNTENQTNHVNTENQTANFSACNHDYEWDVEKAPTETEDGEAVYKCTKCGNISARQPLTAYQYYILTSTNKIKNAKAGSTVTISSKLWNSFPKSFFEQLAKKRDITVKIDFPYDSKNYEITISPTQKIDTSNSKVKYYGPKNLIGTYNAVEVKAK